MAEVAKLIDKPGEREARMTPAERIVFDMEADMLDVARWASLMNHALQSPHSSLEGSDREGLLLASSELVKLGDRLSQTFERLFNEVITKRR